MQPRQGQVVIPVDCVVPDMPVSMDEDSGHLHTMGQKFPGAIPAHYSAQMGHKHSEAMTNAHVSHAYAAGQVPSEPVVDLSVPVNVQPEYLGAPFAPRHGQDIFDTWWVSHLHAALRHALLQRARSMWLWVYGSVLR